jgi:glycosyltransferase involved in cell wall biosynthesis
VRILVVNWQDRLNPNAGGAEVHLHEIFARLAERGHAVTLLVSGWTDGMAEQEVDGMRVVRCGNRNTFPVHVVRRYRDLVAEHGGFDVMVEDINKFPLFSPVWSDLPVVGLVPHLFGTTAFQQANLPVAAAVWASELLMPSAYRDLEFVVISESTADDLEQRGFAAERLHVSYPGIDHSVFRPGESKAPGARIVYVGRLRRYKGVDTVIRAVRLLVDRGLDVAFLIVGKGDDEERLRSVVTELELEDHVRFEGYVSEERKVTLLRTAWLNVYPSPKEGWGITNVEAAACGTPSVASDSPGLRESVRDGATGLLVPHGDSYAWARALQELIEDEVFRRRLAKGAVAHAARFTWEATANQMEDILNLSVTR